MYTALYFHVWVQGHYYTAGYLHSLMLSCCSARKLCSLWCLSLLRCWPDTAALGAWVLLSVADEESAEQIINLKTLRVI